VVVLFNITGDFTQGREAVVRFEDVVGAGGGNDDFLGANCARDVQQMLRVG
jgi:hypothetical protein